MKTLSFAAFATDFVVVHHIPHLCNYNHVRVTTVVFANTFTVHHSTLTHDNVEDAAQ